MEAQASRDFFALVLQEAWLSIVQAFTFAGRIRRRLYDIIRPVIIITLRSARSPVKPLSSITRHKLQEVAR